MRKAWGTGDLPACRTNRSKQDTLKGFPFSAFVRERETEAGTVLCETRRMVVISCDQEGGSLPGLPSRSSYHVTRLRFIGKSMAFILHAGDVALDA